MEDSRRVLFLDLARKRDGSYFRIGVVYDLENRTFSIPTAEQQAKLAREDFGIQTGSVDFHPLVLQSSPSPSPTATRAKTHTAHMDYLKAKSLIAKSFDDLLKAEDPARAQNQEALTRTAAGRSLEFDRSENGNRTNTTDPAEGMTMQHPPPVDSSLRPMSAHLGPPSKFA